MRWRHDRTIRRAAFTSTSRARCSSTPIPGKPPCGFGLNDYSDAHNSAKIDHLIVNNRPDAGYAVFGSTTSSTPNIFVVAVTGWVGAGLVMDQVQFSKTRGAASATTGTAMLIQNGYTFSNTIRRLTSKSPGTCLAITFAVSRSQHLCLALFRVPDRREPPRAAHPIFCSIRSMAAAPGRRLRDRKPVSSTLP